MSSNKSDSKVTMYLLAKATQKCHGQWLFSGNDRRPGSRGFKKLSEFGSSSLHGHKSSSNTSFYFVLVQSETWWTSRILLIFFCSGEGRGSQRRRGWGTCWVIFLTEGQKCRTRSTMTRNGNLLLILGRHLHSGFIFLNFLVDCFSFFSRFSV